MRTVEVVGFERKDLGTKYSKALRAEGNVPCVLYGANDQAQHFHAPMYLFKDLVYTPEAAFVKLNIDGEDFIGTDYGVGPVDAALNAIQKITGKVSELKIDGVFLLSNASSQASAVSTISQVRNTSRLGISRNEAICSTGW